MTVPHPLRGWWRDSTLTAIPLAATAALAALLWLAAISLTGQVAVIAVILAAAVTAGLLTHLGYGTLNAERARRYGCW